MWHIRDSMTWILAAAIEIFTEIECLMDFTIAEFHCFYGFYRCTQWWTQACAYIEAQFWRTLQRNLECSQHSPISLLLPQDPKNRIQGISTANNPKISNQQNFSLCLFSHLNIVLLIVPYKFSSPYWDANFNKLNW